MPKRARGSRGRTKATSARPARLRGKGTATAEETSAKPPPSPSASREITTRSESPPPPPKKRFTRSKAASSMLPPLPQTHEEPPSAPTSPKCSGSSKGHANGAVEKVNQSESTEMHSPLKRLRKQPQRFASRPVMEAPAPSKKSMFEGISRDSLQRYMAHYQIPKRQDLKKNLVQRVQKHFDEVDVDDIDLMSLHRGVAERLRTTALDSPGKLGNAGR